MNMDLRALEHFVAVNRHGGFARAARELNIAQPSLSRSIAQLEGELGMQLFTRDTRGAEISAAGKRFLPYAVAILDDVNRARMFFETPEAEPFERVRLGLSPNLLQPPFDAALGDLIMRSGRYQIEVRTGTMESLVAEVRARTVDLVVCMLADYVNIHADEFDGCGFEEIASEVMIPVARPDHPVFEQDMSLQAAARHDWAVPYQMSVSYRFETAFYKRNITIPHQRLNCASLPLARKSVEEWRLIAMMPERSVAGDLASGALRRLDLPELDFDYTIGFITTKMAPPSPAVLTAMQIFREVVRSL
ncbi:MAG TPA: LysR family transcriptional regulator [Novosphingobium sp.]|nr:LysR family transcriptional regulator [Novosphingobium sp.]